MYKVCRSSGKIFIDLKFLKQVNLEEFTQPYLEYTAFLFGNVQVHRIHFLYVEECCKTGDSMGFPIDEQNRLVLDRAKCSGFRQSKISSMAGLGVKGESAIITLTFFLHLNQNKVINHHLHHCYTTALAFRTKYQS